jgi:hypothetical protein
VVHGVARRGLAVTVAMKLGGAALPKAIRARSLGVRVAFALVLSAATIGALVGGFAWVASGRLLTIAGSWTVLTVPRLVIGLILVPITIVHLLPRQVAAPGACRSPRPGTVTHAPGSVTRRQLFDGRADRFGWRVAWRSSAAPSVADTPRGRGPTLHGIPLAAGRRTPTAHDLLRRGRSADRYRDVAPPRDRRPVNGRDGHVRTSPRYARWVSVTRRRSSIARPAGRSRRRGAASRYRHGASRRRCPTPAAVPSSSALRPGGPTSLDRSVLERRAPGATRASADAALPAANGAPCRLVGPEIAAGSTGSNGSRRWRSREPRPHPRLLFRCLVLGARAVPSSNAAAIA